MAYSDQAFARNVRSLPGDICFSYRNLLPYAGNSITFSLFRRAPALLLPGLPNRRQSSPLSAISSRSSSGCRRS